MDLNAAEVQQRAEADRREVDPPIQVEMATWSKAGRLDWWVKERREWWGTYAVQTAGNGGSELLIFVRPKTSDTPCKLEKNSFEVSSTAARRALRSAAPWRLGLV